MPITLKEFAYFIQEFVNKNFIPHLQTDRQEQEKSLQRWRQVTDMITDLQKVNISNLEQCLKNLDSPRNIDSDKETKQYQQYQKSNANPIAFNMQYIFYHKKDTLPTNFQQEELKIWNILKDNSKQHSQSRIKINKYGGLVQQTKSSSQSQASTQITDFHVNPLGFEKLIHSFRSLYINFDSNHKRLLKQDHKYKYNDKDQLVNQ